MKNVQLVMAVLVLGFLVGCAHGLMRGSVAMKVSDSEAHVCMGKGEVNPGDRITLFRNQCTRGSKAAGGGDGNCKKIKSGEGTVKTVLNEHYSVVDFDSGVQFEEGAFVEKL